MMWHWAKIDLSKTINELEAYIVAQDKKLLPFRKDAQWRTAISQRKSFLKYLSIRHRCTHREIVHMNNLRARLDDPALSNKEIDRVCDGIYLYPLRKRNKANITFEERKDLILN